MHTVIFQGKNEVRLRGNWGQDKVTGVKKIINHKIWNILAYFSFLLFINTDQVKPEAEP